MNNKLLLLSTLLVLVLSIGCNGTSNVSPVGVDYSQATKVYSEAELNKLIISGMTLAEVTNIFGLPGAAVKVADNRVLLNYSFAIEMTPARTTMGGFGIDIKDGRVVRWSPTTVTIGEPTGGGGSQGSFGEQSFQMFLATDSLTNLVTTFESEGSADAKNLKVSPDLAFNAQVFAGSSDNGHPSEWTVILVVSEQDASKLKVLTEKNFGKRLLILCRGKVIAASWISDPIASRQFQFTVKDSSVLNVFKTSREGN